MIILSFDITNKIEDCLEKRRRKKNMFVRVKAGKTRKKLLTHLKTNIGDKKNKHCFGKDEDVFHVKKTNR